MECVDDFYSVIIIWNQSNKILLEMLQEFLSLEFCWILLNDLNICISLKHFATGQIQEVFSIQTVLNDS